MRLTEIEVVPVSRSRYAGEPVDDLGDAGEERPHFLRSVEHVEEDVLAAQVQGQVENSAPIDVSDDAAVAPLQGLDHALQPEKGWPAKAASTSSSRSCRPAGTTWGGASSLYSTRQPSISDSR